MPTVTLRTVWINSLEDSSDRLSFPSMSELSIDETFNGGVRRLAGGRYRHVQRAGVVHTFTLQLPGCDRSQIDWLDEHVGTVLVVRDDRGRKVFGLYATVEVDEFRTTTSYGDVALTLVEVRSPSLVETLQNIV